MKLVEVKATKEFASTFLADPILKMAVNAVLDNAPEFVGDNHVGDKTSPTDKDINVPTKGNRITYDERVKVYTNALVHYGEKKQRMKALEELAECQQAICKYALGEDSHEHLAEEIADATIMLEQLRYFLGLNELVCQKMDEKILRLDKKLGRCLLAETMGE